MAVVDNEIVGHHPRFPENPFARREVVGIEVGEQLEKGRNHYQFAHAARIEARVGAVLCVDWPGRVAEVKDGYCVAVGL
ncbi:MAG: hypothetical protein ABIJ01_01620 [Pseudomonadota bacterium]